MKTTEEIIQHIKERFAQEDKHYINFLRLADAEKEEHHWANAQRFENEANAYQAKKMELNSLFAFITGENWMDTLKVLYTYKESK